MWFRSETDTSICYVSRCGGDDTDVIHIDSHAYTPSFTSRLFLALFVDVGSAIFKTVFVYSEGSVDVCKACVE